MADVANLLGDYLRARRQLLTPEAVGLRATRSRRVVGLRREEVALLAGISAEYYLRLEQGRDRNPSDEVLLSLSRALQLDEAGVQHLLAVGGTRSLHRRLPGRPEVVQPAMASFLAQLPMPAFVEGRYYDVLAANPLATAISPWWRVGGNRLRDVFLDQEEMSLFPDWEDVTAHLAAEFRDALGPDTESPRAVELVEELSEHSERFRRLWGRHDVRGVRGTGVVLEHPRLGTLTLSREKLQITGTSGMVLVAYHAAQGSTDDDKLKSLALAEPEGSDRG